MSDKLYADRDIIGMKQHYTKHVMAMTEEGLHYKSDIAAELGWRDQEIERLNKQLSVQQTNTRGIIIITGYDTGDDRAAIANAADRAGYERGQREALEWVLQEGKRRHYKSGDGSVAHTYDAVCELRHRLTTPASVKGDG